MNRAWTIAFLLPLLGGAGSLFGQAPPGPPDFQQMQKERMQQMQQEVGASSEEWSAFQPLIEQIQQLQRDANGMMGMMMLMRPPGGPGGPGGPPGFNPEQSKTFAALTALGETLEKSDAPATEVKQKLDALTSRARRRERPAHQGAGDAKEPAYHAAGGRADVDGRARLTQWCAGAAVRNQVTHVAAQLPRQCCLAPLGA